MEYKPLTAEQFLKYLEGTIFQTFYDPNSTNKDFPPKVYTSYDYEILKRLNDQKYGIYFSVNAFKDRRVKENVTKLNAVFGDLDVAKEGDGQSPKDILIKKRAIFKKLEELPIKPNIITITKNGVQPIFLIEDPGTDQDTINIYTNTINGLIEWSKGHGCKGDKVKDVTRVLRLPGYYHQKGKPTMVESCLLHESKTTLKELSKLFPYFDEEKIKNDNATKDGQPSVLDALSMQDIALAALKEYGEPNAYFDNKDRIWLDRGVTGAFLGKQDNCDYIASNSHELPYGNKITFVRRLLKLEDNKAAFKWIAKEFNLQTTPKENEQIWRLTDTANAEKINELFGDKIRFDHRRKRWLMWQGHRWQPDVDGAINRLAIEAARKRFIEALEITDKDERLEAVKWALASESKGRLDAAVGIAKNLLPITDSGDNWDADTMLLSCPNGIVDLKTGLIRDGRPEDRITMVAGVSYDPTAECPLWDRFISEVFQGDGELIRYVQKALGYSVTGSVREQVVFFGFGIGSNGKSVLFSTIRAILNNYAYNAPASMFQRNPMNTSTNDVAATEFKRFLMSSEILSSTKIDEVRLKKWSGGDQETARFLYSEFFSFYPTCKIWLFVNHKPWVEDDSYGFWRRVQLIPFNRVFKVAEQDKDLPEKLKGELPGILNWLIKGCLLWQEEGLAPVPEIVSSATRDYQQENDVLAEFLAEMCVVQSGAEIKALEFFKSYTQWAEGQGLTGKDVLSNAAFGRRMTDKFIKKRKDGRAFYQGVVLKNGENSQNSSGFDDKSVPEVVVDPHFMQTSPIYTREDSLLEKTSNPLLTHENPLQPATQTQTEKLDSCYLCNGTSFYKNPSEILTCSRCHPPTEEVKQ